MDHRSEQGEEFAVRLENGNTIRCESVATRRRGCSYVRVCGPDGAEIAYWSAAEWAEDPETVMGALLGAAGRAGGDDDPGDDGDGDDDHRHNPAPFCAKCGGTCRMGQDRPDGPGATALPSPEEVGARLEACNVAYRQAVSAVVAMSLVEVLVVTRRYAPHAAFVRVQESDTDASGHLTAGPNGVLDPQGHTVAYPAEMGDEWADQVWGALSNLDDASKWVWRPFTVSAGAEVRLDLGAVEAALPRLMGHGA